MKLPNVETAYKRPTVRPDCVDVVHGEAHGKGRDTAQQRDRHGEQDQRDAEGQHDDRHVEIAQILQAVARQAQQRQRQKRDEADEKRAPRDDAIERDRVGGSIGPATADDVSGGEIQQDQADHHGRDQIRRAEDGREQAEGGQFDGQRHEAAEENGDEQLAIRDRRQGAAAAGVWLLIMATGIIIENVMKPPSLPALPGEAVTAVQSVRCNG